MNNTFKIAIAFVSGFAIGAFAMTKFIDYKNEQKYCEESDEENNIEEVEEYDVTDDLEEAFSDNENTINASTRESRVDYSKIKSVNDAEYNRLLDELRYNVDKQAEENAANEPVYVEEEIDRTKPYYIPQSDFEELDEYESDEYTYYADGYLTDSYGMPVYDEDIENAMGLGFEKYFDKYGEDQIWIRNERIKMDFSIIIDLDKFIDVATPRIRRMAGL